MERTLMSESLYWIAWVIFFIAALATVSGAVIVYKYDTINGLYIIFSGIIALAISGLIMTLACGIPSKTLHG